MSFASYSDAELPRVRAQVPSAFVPLFTSCPYKVMYGGRGSAKSWQYARALVVQAHHERHLVLCTREFQNSISDSVHRVLRTQIELLGLRDWFTVTDRSIRSRLTGSEFIFKGLRRNIEEIKSLEGVTRTWIEEAQSASEESWLYLIPTVMRSANSEIWVSFNPVSEDDPTFQRMVVNARPNWFVRKVSWRDNPWFPPQLEEERRWAMQHDPGRYDWVWEGNFRRISDASVFRGRYTVEGFEEPPDVDRFFYGADWGFANDPSVLIRMYIRDEVLYITHEAYAVGVEIDDLAALFAGGVVPTARATHTSLRGEPGVTGIVLEGVPGARDWPIFADNSRPETISYLARQGLPIKPADKWPGSVEDGIAHLKAFKRIVVHERCVNTAAEFRLYSYKTDRLNDKIILPKIEDKNNHCIDAIRYGLNGYIQRRGGLGVWAKLAGR